MYTTSMTQGNPFPSLRLPQTIKQKQKTSQTFGSLFFDQYLLVGDGLGQDSQGQNHDQPIGPDIKEPGTLYGDVHPEPEDGVSNRYIAYKPFWFSSVDATACGATWRWYRFPTYSLHVDQLLVAFQAYNVSSLARFFQPQGLLQQSC